MSTGPKPDSDNHGHANEDDSKAQPANIPKNALEQGSSLQGILQGRSTIVEEPSKLQVALLANDVDGVRDLIDHGSDVNAYLGGHRPLELALKQRNQRMVEMLLDRGAKTKTMLKYAITEGNDLDMIKMLVEHNARVNARPWNSVINVFQRAAKTVVDVLWNTKDIPYQGGELEAALTRNTEIVRFLIEGGADVNAKCYRHGNILQAAISEKSGIDTIRFLLEHGAQVNAQGGQYGTALQAAARRGEKDIVVLLLENGADVYARGGRCVTAIEAAVTSRNSSITRLLLDHGADPGTSGLLEITAKAGDLTTAKLLLQSEDIDYHRRSNQSVIEALRVASASGQESYVSGLLTYLQGVPEPIWIAIENLARKKDPSIPLARLPEGWLVCNWEICSLLPPTLFNPAEKDRAKAIADFIDNTVVISGSKEKYLACTIKQFIQRHFIEPIHPFVEVVSEALASKGTPIWYQSDVSTMAVRATDDFIMVYIDSKHFLKMIKLVNWFCLALRPLPSEEKNTVVSKGTQKWWRYTPRVSGWTLSVLEPSDIQVASCWTQLFSGSVIVDFPIERSWGKGLQIDFDLLVQLASVQNAIYLPAVSAKKQEEPRVALVGFFTALVPVGYHEQYGVQWHLYTSEDLITLDSINLQSNGQTLCMSLERLRSLSQKGCYVGWCDNANILLGTKDFPNTVSWTGLPQRSESLDSDGKEFAGQAGFTFPFFQVGGQATKTYKLVNVRQKFDQVGTYGRAIQIASQQVALIYDTDVERGWLVPKLSLMLHLCHSYFGYFLPTEKDTLPFAEPSANGSDAAQKALSGKSEEVVKSYGTAPEDIVYLHNVLLDISCRLSGSPAIAAQARMKVSLFQEAMDAVAGPGTGAPLTEVSTKRLSPWSKLLPVVDAVCVCADLGFAIKPTGVMPQTSNLACTELEPGRHYLAAHTWCLENLLRRKGTNLEKLRLSTGDIWDARWEVRSFNPCNHTSKQSCWAEPTFLQRISDKPRIDRCKKVPAPRARGFQPTGALVFGN